jgi:hypothetical protein
VGAVSYHGEMGEGARRNTRMEPGSRKRRPLWTASSRKTDPKWVCKGLDELSTIFQGSTHKTPTWLSLTAEAVKVADVFPKALHSTRRALALHERHSQQECPSRAAYHRAMIAYYHLLATLFSMWQRHAKPSRER